MKFVTIASKGLKEMIRDRGLLAMTLLFPLVFMLVFGYAFGASVGQNTSYQIIVLNNDVGTTLSYGNSEYFNFGENFTKVLSDIKYENSSVSMFNLQNATREEALNLLMKRNIACIVTIPENFSEAMQATINLTIRTASTSLPVLPEAGNVTATMLLEGDNGYMNFGIAQSIIRGVLSTYIAAVQSETIQQISKTIPDSINVLADQKYLSVESISVSGTRAFTAFDYQAPGIVIFGLLMGSVGIAGALARESESQTLSRLKISLMRSIDLLFGTLLPWTLLAIIQLLILFGVALATGFHWLGGLSSLLIAILIGGIAGVACVSLGLLVAAFAKNESQAGTLGTLISVPLSFLIGSFFPLPVQTEVVTQFLPWRQAFTALTSILTYGAQFQEVVPNILAMTLETAVLFSIGVFAFAKIKLKPE